MSRDQFSQLMLVYTGMAADIAEIFEAFRESKVEIQRILRLLTLIIRLWWTLTSHMLFLECGIWVLYSFVFLLEPHTSLENLWGLQWTCFDQCSSISSSSYNHQTSKSSTGSRISFANNDDKKFMDADIIAIILAIVLQDLPFICLRLSLILKYWLEIEFYWNLYMIFKDNL